jgi:hypothetical protein
LIEQLPSQFPISSGGCLERTINLHDLTKKITVGKSGANTAAICGASARFDLLAMSKDGYAGTV